MSFYKINRGDLTRVWGKTILIELIGHIPREESFTGFPSTFYVLLSPDSEDDTDGIQYYRELDDTESFLQMGYSDTGFYATYMLLATIGVKV